MPGQYDLGPGPRRSRMPYHGSPRQPFTPQAFQMRSPANRHEPYHIPRPVRRASSDTSFTDSSQLTPGASFQPGAISTPQESLENIVMKTEPCEDNESDMNKDEDNTNSSTGTNEQSESRTGDGQGGIDSDPNSVKVEAISESEFELEITGVEPGRPAMPPENWVPDVSMGMNFDPSQGAAGTQADISGQQGYSKCILPNIYFLTISKVLSSFVCLSTKLLSISDLFKCILSHEFVIVTINMAREIALRLLFITLLFIGEHNVKVCM